MHREEEHFESHCAGWKTWEGFHEVKLCLKPESKLIIQVKNKEKVITDKRNGVCEGPRV